MLPPDRAKTFRRTVSDSQLVLDVGLPGSSTPSILSVGYALASCGCPPETLVFDDEAHELPSIESEARPRQRWLKTFPTSPPEWFPLTRPSRKPVMLRDNLENVANVALMRC